MIAGTLTTSQRTLLTLSLCLTLLFLVGCIEEEVPTEVARALVPTASFTPFWVSPTPPVAATPTPSPAPTNSPRPRATATAAHTPSPTPCATNGTVRDGVFYSATAGADHDYRLYLPPCYQDGGRRYPVLYLLAGNIHDETKWDELGVDEAADALIQAGQVAPMIIVMPDGGWLANNTSGGPGSYESLVLNDLIPYIEAHYCAWPDSQGRAIGGLSRGGYWALEIAFRFPENFASAGGHSAALLDQYAGPAVNPQQTGPNNPLGDLRVYLDIGADDYLRTNTIQLHQDMEAAGVPHTWRLNEGRHEDAYWQAHIEEYVRWYAGGFSAQRQSYPPCE